MKYFWSSIIVAALIYLVLGILCQGDIQRITVIMVFAMYAKSIQKDMIDES